MPIIVDTSVCMGWFITDEANAVTASVLGMLNDQGALMPALWYYEIRSALLTQERRKRISVEQSEASILFLQNLPIELDYGHHDKTLMRLARRYNLTGYDTTYLELALRENLPLATFDKALIAAAKNEGITLLT
jgi:predicted nucleic acid-binding protein